MPKVSMKRFLGRGMRAPHETLITRRRIEEVVVNKGERRLMLKKKKKEVGKTAGAQTLPGERSEGAKAEKKSLGERAGKVRQKQKKRINNTKISVANAQVKKTKAAPPGERWPGRAREKGRLLPIKFDSFVQERRNSKGRLFLGVAWEIDENLEGECCIPKGRGRGGYGRCRHRFGPRKSKGKS